MNLSDFSDKALSRIRKSDRRGVLTGDEAQASFIAKSEKELQNQIAKLLMLRGIPFYQSRMDRKTTGTVGWPDFVFPHLGKFVSWEVKMPGRSLDPAQVKMRDAITAHGGIWVLITSVESARAHLDQLKK